LKFAKERRLRRRAEFQSVFAAARKPKQGGMVRNSHFVIYYKKTDEAARLGLSIPRKVIKSASKRNRVKRCWREFFRTKLLQHQGDLVFRLTKEPQDFSFQSITSSLELCIKKINKNNRLGLV